MQNQFQADWRERSLFYHCRMFTADFPRGEVYEALAPCIHVGILNFTLLKTPGFHHCFQLMEQQSHEIYSDKFIMHVIQLKQLNVAPSDRDQELYRWARLIAAKDWEGIQMAAKGNTYMETAMDEMEKINMNKNERYLYLRRQMAESDMASMVNWANRQFQEGTNQGRLEGLREGKIEIVLRMLDQGFACEDISKLTDLPLSEVTKMKTQRE